jgi:hypothetical protein
MVKTYLNYQQEKVFSGSFLNKPQQTKLITCPELGDLLLSPADETLLISKAGSNAEILRVFPFSGQSSAELTCVFPFFMSKDLAGFWEEEKSDGEGIDDPFGLFQEEKPLHQMTRNLVLTSGSGSGYLFGF